MTAPADPRSLRLSELSDCAFRLGKEFGEAAQRAEAWERRVELFDLFERCFFAVRVATALELRLARQPAAQPAAARAEGIDRDERDREEVERPDAPERYDERDREREQDVERPSLPVLLRTLEGVAADGEALPGRKPAALPSLRELLTHVTAAPPAGPPAPGLRARLAGSGAAATLTLPSPARPARQVSSPLRRATGPPRR